ncbi:MAG: metallophosphoesterase [Candidatus Marinarcus sp.]|uniref:metallophosphoesterase n=1 Tax=Candidatus Marinarcus sp. TaxID=3100987 RepID=UPI003AFFBE65
MLVRYYPVVPNTVYFLLSIPIGIIFLLFTTTLVYDFFSYTINKTVKDEPRRTFFKKSLDIASLVLATSVNAKAIYNARTINIEDVSIKINNLTKKYTLVQISDIHIGGLINTEFMASLIKKINHLTPDIVVITGDLIDTDMTYAKNAVDQLQNIQSKYGTYFIVGNHEYFHDVGKIISYVKTLGIKVLENESVYIGEASKGFNLCGVYDIFGYRTKEYVPDINKALENIDENSPTLLLAHQPKYIYEVPSSIDLVLSGHTHGGQIVPFNLLVRLVQPYIKGLHQHNETTQIYVNKGTGFWGPPMRLGASSEVTHITLS